MSAPEDGEFERLTLASAQAMGELESELARQAQKSGVDAKLLAQLVLLKETNPQEFALLHDEASRIAAEDEAKLLKLKAAAKELKSAIDAESGIADPFKLHAARVQLQQLNAQIKQMDKQ